MELLYQRIQQKSTDSTKGKVNSAWGGCSNCCRGESETHAEALSHMSETEIADIVDADDMNAEDKMIQLRKGENAPRKKPSM